VGARLSFPEEGTWSISTVVTDSGGNHTVIGTTATVADASLAAGQAVALTSSTGAALANALVGSFTDADPTAPLGDFTGIINWGDGTAPSPGTISQPGGVGTPFFVSGSHSYATPGSYVTQVSLTDAGGSTVTLSGSATVSDLAVTGAVNNFNAVEGSSTGKVVLATFTAPNPLATALGFTATLPAGGWGDGTPAAPVTLVVTPIGGSATSTVFEVTGIHTYAEFGAYPVNISITTAGGVTTALTPGTATITDAALAVSQVNPITATEGAAPANFIVAAFTDGNASASSSDFTATVTATSSTGRTFTGAAATVTSAGAGSFVVKANLAFPDEGTWTIATVVTDAGGSQTRILTPATVADAPLTAGPVLNLMPSTAASATNVVGTFTDANPTAPLGDFTATINWGDGSNASTGTISQPGGVGTPFLVSGSHAYATPGSYVTAISVTDVGGSTATLNGTAAVTDLPAAGAVNNFTAVEGASTGTIVLATFTDPIPHASASSVTATLPAGGWGDGTPAAPITLTVTPIGGTATSTVFQVTGSHTYAKAGSYGVNVAITTSGGVATPLASGTATIADAPLTPGAGNPVTAVAGAPAATFTVATFADTNPLASAAEFTATVTAASGTGQTMSGGAVTVTPQGNGLFAVSASLSFPSEGTWSISTHVADFGGSQTLIGTTATVADAPLAAGPAVALTPSTGAAVTNAVVGSFSDADPLASPSNFSAVIKWGDGASSAATIIQPGGVGTPFQVVGTHAYATPGGYSTQISVADSGGSKLTLSGTAAVTDLSVTGAIDDFSVVAGQNTGTIVLATFTDPNPVATLTSVSATLAPNGWGDGTPLTSVPLAVTPIGGTANSTVFQVSGSHTYAAYGAYPVNISVTTSGGATTLLTPGTATVADAALTPGSGTPVTATAGAPATNFTVATFNYASSHATAANFSATVTATSSTGQIVTGNGVTITRLGSGQYTVSAALAFPQDGTWSVATVVTDLAGSQVLVSTTASVSPAPVAITLTTPVLTYNGSPQHATATTSPSGVAVTFTYNGSVVQPTDAGTYTIIASSIDPNYAGTVVGTMVVAPAASSVAVTTPVATYDGAPHGAAAVVSGINGGANPGSATFTYFAGTSATGTPLPGAPTEAGTYTVLASYAGSTDYLPATQTATFTIARATPNVVINASNALFNGSPQPAAALVFGVPNGSTPGAATLTYFTGTDTTGTPLNGPPAATGTYTVQAVYNGNSDYLPFYSTATYTIFSPPTIATINGTGTPGASILLAPVSASTDGGTISYSILTQPGFGTVSLIAVGGNQQFLYQPGTGVFTSDAFTYQVTDSLGGTVTGTATISYAGVGLVSSSLNSGAKDLAVIENSGSHTVTFANGGSAAKVKVTVDGVPQGTYTVTGRVFGFAGSGNDLFNGSAISRSIWLYGGSGNNTFIGGSGPDVLIGGTGNDYLNGRTGRNILIGGGGTNTLVGSSGSDILIAGTTLYNAPSFANQAALLQILNAWQTAKTAPSIPTVGAGHSAAPALSPVTVSGSDTGDVLIGNKKSWFFGNFTYNGGTNVFNDGRHITGHQYLTPLAGERVTQIGS
jgi:hypothetical protein